MVYSGITDTGKVRKNNEDAFYIEEFDLKCTGTSAVLAVVCDGMGGAVAGEKASSIAVRTFSSNVVRQVKAYSDELSNLDNIPFEKILRDGVKMANKAVLAESTQNPDCAGMGTTLAAVLCTPDRIFAINIGDSRIYKLENDSLIKISNDHSYVQSLIENGTITEAEAKVHPERNIILKAIGASVNTDPDTFVLSDIPQKILICSDGLTNMLQDIEIATILTEEPDTQKEVRLLVDSANIAGGLDNITAVVISL